MSYQYLLAPRGDGFAIVHVQSCTHVGYVKPCGAKYRVRNEEGDEIAIVNSNDEAIPALVTYYKNNPPRWERESGTRYSKTTPFGPLMIEKNQSGKWLAYRYYTDWYHPLPRAGKPAIFATRAEAQRAADAHVRDDYPNAETTDDGLSWALE
jgi:hypothetical protein